MNQVCAGHSGHEARIENLENMNKDQWSAIEKIREDIKTVIGKIGVLVGGIALLNTVVVGVVVYYVTKGS